jgi:dihydrofolate reductase
VVVRQAIVFVNSSVDGFMGSPSGDLSWLIHDDEMDHDFTSDLRRTADTILSGRVVFESFAAAWPARAADRSGPPELVEFANWMLDTPKVVFSTGVTCASMKNSRIASRPIADEVAHLRDEAGGDMVVFGGARTVDAFVRLGLVDEFWLKVHPVAIGAGLPVFGGLPGPADFGLAWHKVYASGVVGVRYRRLSAGADMTRSRYVE